MSKALCCIICCLIQINAVPSCARYLGSVKEVTVASGSVEVRVKFSDGSSETLPYPDEDIEILSDAEDALGMYPASFQLGDVVDVLQTPAFLCRSPHSIAPAF